MISSLSKRPFLSKQRRLLERSFSAWTQKIVQATDGAPLNVSLYAPSAAEKTILCLPGALGTGPSDFEALLSGGLGDRFGVVALDPRGLGGSTGVRTFPLDFYRRDALDGAAAMKQLGHDRYSVLGWSDGANSALHLASHPSCKDAVEKLVVWGGNAYVTQEDVDAWEGLRDVSNWSSRMREKSEALHGTDRLQELNDDATDGWIRMYTEAAGDVCLEALHQVACPTLVVHGAKDVICDMKHARYIAKHVADSQLVVLAEGKHNLHQRHADTFHPLVADFLLEETTQEKEEKSRPEPAIDQIAYAFMGSKAMATAVKAGVFDAIHHSTNNAATFSQIDDQSEIKGERLKTLLSACVSLSLIRRNIVQGQDIFSLPQASTDQLVTTSKHYWGDYIANQVDTQFYSRMASLDRILRTGDTESDGYETWFDSDPEAARNYTLAQHNGSLATAYALHRRFPGLAQRPSLKLLDVGGGSGAFSIATCRKIVHAECVVLDLPNVTKVAKDIIAEEKDDVQRRISIAPLPPKDAGNWEGLVEDGDYDAVLMSYVSGSIPLQALPGLYSNAFKALKPGGVAILHDFFVDNDGDGPTNAALWALAHTTVNPDGMGLRPNRIVQLLTEAGFVAPKVDTLIPKTTQTILATKPIHSKL